MSEPIKLVAFCGSLRKASFNRLALHAFTERLPAGVTVETIEIDWPLYSADIQAQGFPAAVQAANQKVMAADGVVFASPEYNYSVSGVLKNAIDWASRPYGDSAWNGKPAAIMGASIGAIGTARAQYHLRQIMVFLNMFPINQPEVMIGHAAERFDKDGNLTDETTKGFIRQLLTNLVAWTRRLQQPQPT